MSETEFGFIRHLKSELGLTHIGDDCAVVPRDGRTDLVITSDMLAEDVDFRLDWSRPAQIGIKTLTASLSDVAAMGARPLWAMISVGITEREWAAGFAKEFYRGLTRHARQHGVEIVGGDISRTVDRIVIDCTCIGEVEHGQAVRRSGARPGDRIFVSVPLGGAAAGLRLLETGARPGDGMATPAGTLIKKQLEPQPADGPRIAAMGATAMIDISDGLSSDLHHLCEASGVGAIVFSESIPIDPNIAASGFSQEDALSLALHGGEGYELLFTLRSDRAAALDASGEAEFYAIGEITGINGTVELVTEQGRGELLPRGYFHF